MKPSEIQEIMNDDILSEEEKKELISEMLQFYSELSKKGRKITPEWKKKQDRSHEYHCESIQHGYATHKGYYKSEREIDKVLREEYN